MKIKSLLLGWLVFMPMMVYAQDVNTLCLHTKSGKLVYFLLDDKPNVIINEDGVNITTTTDEAKYRVTYTLNNFLKFTLESNNKTSIGDAKSQSYKIENNVITTKGAISAYKTSGQLYAKSKTRSIIF